MFASDIRLRDPCELKLSTCLPKGHLQFTGYGNKPRGLMLCAGVTEGAAAAVQGQLPARETPESVGYTTDPWRQRGTLAAINKESCLLKVLASLIPIPYIAFESITSIRAPHFQLKSF